MSYNITKRLRNCFILLPFFCGRKKKNLFELTIWPSSSKTLHMYYKDSTTATHVEECRGKLQKERIQSGKTRNTNRRDRVEDDEKEPSRTR